MWSNHQLISLQDTGGETRHFLTLLTWSSRLQNFRGHSCIWGFCAKKPNFAERVLYTRCYGGAEHLHILTNVDECSIDANVIEDPLLYFTVRLVCLSVPELSFFRFDDNLFLKVVKIMMMLLSKSSAFMSYVPHIHLQSDIQSL